MPDTSAAYHAAYVIVTAMLVCYALTLWLRARRVRHRLSRRMESVPR